MSTNAASTPERIAGVVLAGGRSSRMGRNKALLSYEGKPLVEHVAGLLRAAGLDDVYIGGTVSGYDGIPDEVSYKGPAFAMTALLDRFSGRYGRLLFVPVDMPLIPVKLLRQLIAYDGSAFFENYPLPACIKTGRYDGGDISVKGLLRTAGTTALPLGRTELKGMVNVNTPVEWEEIAS